VSAISCVPLDCSGRRVKMLLVFAAVKPQKIGCLSMSVGFRLVRSGVTSSYAFDRRLRK